MLFTIGTTRKSLREFVALLQGASVDAVIDTRLSNTSQLAGYAKKEDLEYVLTAFCGIAYEHRAELAPPAALLDRFREDRDWERYRRGFRARMRAEGMTEVVLGTLERYQNPCLLCACHDARRCHRTLLAEGAQKQQRGLEVRHLG